MKKISSTSSNFLLLSMLFIAILGLSFSSDSLLYAYPKKTMPQKKSKKVRIAEAKKTEQKYVQLQEDYTHTVDNFIIILDKMITTYGELEEKVKKLESNASIQHQKLIDIRNYLYQKSLDPSYCPFEILKHWYEDPFDQKMAEIEQERHLVGSDFDIE